ncbi:AmmeMemoRadiSam system protein B [bacterium]|nr:AmmeMemoRadiSam system protein B [bacterium]
MEYPKLRPVQFFPVVAEGKLMGCIHDPQRFCDKPLIIPWDIVPVLASLDGKHSLQDIKVEYTKNCGNILFHEDLISFLERLDYYLLLHSKRFDEFKEKLTKEFINSPVRPAFFSGLSYPADPRLLIEKFEAYFTSPEGPGWPDKNRKINNRLTGIIAPHIDLESGGHCYAWAYSELIKSSYLPELFIILGTCHAGVENMFCLTDKTFLTPLGEVKCNKKFIGCIKNRCHADIFSEELLHRSEHTIEFQALFLKFIWERFSVNKPALEICPILCSFTPDSLSEGSPQKDIYNDFIEALKKAILYFGKSVCIIASADLSHIGAKFGDLDVFDTPITQVCFDEDIMMLEIIAQKDRKGFRDNMMRSYLKRRICGYPPITVMLDILPPSQGKILNYGHSIVDEQGSMTTFASMIFFE